MLTLTRFDRTGRRRFGPSVLFVWVEVEGSQGAAAWRAEAGAVCARRIPSGAAIVRAGQAWHCDALCPKFARAACPILEIAPGGVKVALNRAARTGLTRLPRGG